MPEVIKAYQPRSTSLNVSNSFKEIAGELESFPFLNHRLVMPSSGPILFLSPRKSLKREENFPNLGRNALYFMESGKFNIYNSLPILFIFSNLTKRAEQRAMIYY